MTDTWTFHTDRFVEPVETGSTTDGWVVEETGPLRARVRSEGWLGRSGAMDAHAAPLTSPGCTSGSRSTSASASSCCRCQSIWRLLPLAGPTVCPAVRWSAPQPDGVAGAGLVPRGRRGPSTGPRDRRRLQPESGGDSLAVDPAQQPEDGLGRRRARVYAGRDWHTDQGPHTFDFVLFVGEHLEETVLHTAARQQMQPPSSSTATRAWTARLGETVPREPSGWARWNGPWQTEGWATCWRMKTWTPCVLSSRGSTESRAIERSQFVVEVTVCTIFESSAQTHTGC